jgi:hypothetical protein
MNEGQLSLWSAPEIERYRKNQAVNRLHYPQYFGETQLSSSPTRSWLLTRLQQLQVAGAPEADIERSCAAICSCLTTDHLAHLAELVAHRTEGFDRFQGKLMAQTGAAVKEAAEVGPEVRAPCFVDLAQHQDAIRTTGGALHLKISLLRAATF